MKVQRKESFQNGVYIALVLLCGLVGISNMIVSDFHSQSATPLSASVTGTYHERSLTLMGIMSTDDEIGAMQRQRHRRLFQVWRDPRLCSLAEWESAYASQKVLTNCQLLYTFVVGVNKDPEAPTEMVEPHQTLPLLVQQAKQPTTADINDQDVTRLNIRENVDEGKSQTFLYYSAILLEAYSFDFVMKVNGDVALQLHDYFAFAHAHLPPTPYNTGILAGAIRDKAYWPNQRKHNGGAWTDPKESMFYVEYDGVHLYMDDPLYILSRDLAESVVTEVPYSKVRLGEGYLEDKEAHDVPTMAFHSTTPLQVISVPVSRRFWNKAEISDESQWERAERREFARLQGIPFEGHVLQIYAAT